MFPLIIGVAAFIDGLATGIWVGKKWVSKAALDTAVKSALDRATTLPSGGLTAIASEVVEDAKEVADKVTGVVTSASASADAVVAGAASLQKLLAAAHVTK